MNGRVDCFAVTAPGLAGLVAAELERLAIAGDAPIDAGVPFKATLPELYSANLHLRVASRILVRLARFHAAHFSELADGASKVPWDRWLKSGTTVDLRVTCKKSRLYHSGAVAERLIEQLDRKGLQARVLKAEDEEGATPSQLLVVRVDRDECTISIDSSGDLLHRRGYRKAVAKAPLRETLAAAILLASCSNEATSLVDPMCGSGTIPIEAALRARRIAPGLGRHFAFEQWVGFRKGEWQRLKEEAAEGALDRAPAPIMGSDRDAGAIEASLRNAERAGVSGDIEFVQQSLSAATPPPGKPGLLIANPPYGERVSEGRELRDLYARFGDVARRHFAGWSVGILAADPKLVSQTRLPLERRFSTTNGGIHVSLWAMG
jgi:putative N6-adenine-specific DNA methylase